MDAYKENPRRIQEGQTAYNPFGREGGDSPKSESLSTVLNGAEVSLEASLSQIETILSILTGNGYPKDSNDTKNCAGIDNQAVRIRQKAGAIVSQLNLLQSKLG